MNLVPDHANRWPWSGLSGEGDPRVRCFPHLVAAVVAALALAAPAMAVECPRLSEPHRVSYENHERRLFTKMLERIREVRNSAPDTQTVLAIYGACLEKLASGELADSLARARLSLDPQRHRLTLSAAGGAERSVRTGGDLARLAPRAVASLMKVLAPAPEREGEIENALWYLWFESVIRSSGERFDHYVYADQVLEDKAEGRGRSFTVGFDPTFEGGRLLVGTVRDPALIRGGLVEGMPLVRLDGRVPSTLSHSRLSSYWLREQPFDYTIEVGNAGTMVRLAAHAMPHRHRTLRALRRRAIDYLRLSGFSGESLLELRRAVRRADREEDRGLILDLRDNPGGVFSPGLVDLFLKPGQTVASYQDRDRNEAVDLDATVEYYALPLVLLVDGETVSMAETLAAAIKTHHRGTLVGERTFGKGVGQTVSDILDEGRLALVDRTYFYPGTRVSWNGEGIEVDIPVEIPDSLRETLDLIYENPLHDLESLAEQDPVLRRGIEVLEESP